jgi:osmotically-inducible protein OsmY
MNKLCNLLIATTLFFISTQQYCWATDFDPLTPPASSVSAAGGNNAGEVSLAIQQSNLPEGSKHVNVSYKNGAIIINGTVDSDHDRQEIGNIAAKCGCVNVRNELTIRQIAKTNLKQK